MRIVIIFIVVLIMMIILPGCAGFGLNAPDYSQLTAGQAKASASIKDANFNYMKFPTPWGTGISVNMSIDKSVMEDGVFSMTPNSDGGFTFTNTKVVKPKEETEKGETK